MQGGIAFILQGCGGQSEARRFTGRSRRCRRGWRAQALSPSDRIVLSPGRDRIGGVADVDIACLRRPAQVEPPASGGDALEGAVDEELAYPLRRGRGCANDGCSL